MIKLTETLNESVGKSSYIMLAFFQEMVRQGELRAYVVKTAGRGVELTATQQLPDHQPAIVEDAQTGVRYHLDIGSYGGQFYDDGDSQTIYHHCLLERLTNFNPKKVASITGSSFACNRLSIPEGMVDARLRVSHSDDWESAGEQDVIARTNGGLVVEGKHDGLFEKVCKFVRGS